MGILFTRYHDCVPTEGGTYLQRQFSFWSIHNARQVICPCFLHFPPQTQSSLKTMALTITNSTSTIFPEGGWDVHHHVFDRKQQSSISLPNLTSVSVEVFILRRPSPYTPTSHHSAIPRFQETNRRYSLCSYTWSQLWQRLHFACRLPLGAWQL